MNLTNVTSVELSVSKTSTPIVVLTTLQMYHLISFAQRLMPTTNPNLKQPHQLVQTERVSPLNIILTSEVSDTPS